MKFFEYTQESLDHWRADERTQAALDWIKELHRSFLADLVSKSRSDGVESIRYLVGKMDTADVIIQQLERGK